MALVTTSLGGLAGIFLVLKFISGDREKDGELVIMIWLVFIASQILFHRVDYKMDNDPKPFGTVVEWQTIETAPNDEYVLVACPSGYVTMDWDYRMAKYDSERQGWIEVSGDWLTEYGLKPLWWAPLPNNPPNR